MAFSASQHRPNAYPNATPNAPIETFYKTMLDNYQQHDYNYQHDVNNGRTTMTCYYNHDSYWYAYGYTSRAKAEIALEIAYNRGDVMPGENPRVETYKNKDGATRYGIRLN